jgi:hypothetical protein
MNMGKFVLNVVVAFVVYGILYGAVGPMLFSAGSASMAEFLRPEAETGMGVFAYHLVQTIVFVWLFGKAVGSGDLKAGAMFGLMVGFYLMATDSVWFASIAGMPADARMPYAVLNLVNNAIVGTMLAFMHGKGWGASGGDEAESTAE